MKWWKVIGLAGVAGVAGVAGASALRRRRQWAEADPEELRDRLRARFAESPIAD